MSATWGARRCPGKTRMMLGDSEDHGPLAGQVPGRALSVSGVTSPTLLPALEGEHLGQSGVPRPQGLLTPPNPCRWTQAGSGRRQVVRSAVWLLLAARAAPKVQEADSGWALWTPGGQHAAGTLLPGGVPRAAPDAGMGAPQDPTRGGRRRAWTWLRGFRSSFQEPIELLEGVGEKTRLSTRRQEEAQEGPGGRRLHLLRGPAAPGPPTCAQSGARPESAARRCPVWEPRVKTRDTSQRDHDRHRPGHRTRWHNHATRAQRHCKNQREKGGFLVSTTQSLKKLDKTYGKSYRNPSEKGTRAKRWDIGRKGHT